MKRQEERARKELERASASQAKGVGRPLKGREVRIPVTNRWEPSMLIELVQMTGCSTGELVERVHSLLKLVSEYREAKDAVVAKLEQMLTVPLDKAS